MKKVALKLKKRSVPERIQFARSVVLQMTGNAYFATPNPTLDSISTAADNLENAFVKAQKGGEPDTADVQLRGGILDRLLTAEGAYVENIANANTTSPEAPQAIILSAGMEVKTQGSINIPLLSVKQGDEAGSLQLRRKSAGKKIVYKWQLSADPFSNTSWKDAGHGSLAKFVITDLTPVTRYWFRVAIIRGNVQEDFSDPVTFVVS